MAEPLSLTVIDQIAKDGWVEGWQVEVEEEEEKVKMVVEKVENGVEKVEQGKKEIGGKKEELGRIPLSVSRYFIFGSLKKHSLFVRKCVGTK